MPRRPETCAWKGCDDPVEQIDDWSSQYCPRHNDVLINRANRRREWDHFHPGEPMPKAERDG